MRLYVNVFSHRCVTGCLGVSFTIPVWMLTLFLLQKNTHLKISGGSGSLICPFMSQVLFLVWKFTFDFENLSGYVRLKSSPAEFLLDICVDVCCSAQGVVPPCGLRWPILCSQKEAVRGVWTRKEGHKQGWKEKNYPSKSMLWAYLVTARHCVFVGVFIPSLFK